MILSVKTGDEIEQMANRMIIINKGKSLVEGSVSELIHNRQHQVSFRITDPLKTQKIISESQWNSKLSASNEEKFDFQLKKEEIPEFTSFLTNKGCKIYAIEPIRSLEEYFLQITENEKSN